MKTKTTFTPTALFVNENYRAEFDKAMRFMKYQGVETAPCTARFDFVADAHEMIEILKEYGVPSDAISVSKIVNINTLKIINNDDKLIYLENMDYKYWRAWRYDSNGNWNCYMNSRGSRINK